MVNRNNINNDLKKAVLILKKEGAKKVFLFGSTAIGKSAGNSDYDLGIKGLPPESFFKTYDRISKEINSPIDLVDFDKENDFYNMLKDIDEVVEIG
jgi:predicted nucleotidyltransferase